MSESQFQTSSLVLAAFVEVRCGLSGSIHFSDSRNAVFFFPRTAEVIGAVQAFDNDGEVPARRYSRAVSILRDRLLQLRQGNLNTEKKNGQGLVRQKS